MRNGIRQICRFSLVHLLSGSMLLFAEPLPQNPQAPDQEPSIQVVPDDSNRTQSPSTADSATAVRAPVNHELPDAPSLAQPVQQNSNESSSKQQGNSVPSGAAGAKAPTVRGAPASRTVGAAIAPAKQRQKRSLLIKVGLIAGACVAVGSAFALSKASPSKPPGAP
jgi:hypothetical protein